MKLIQKKHIEHLKELESDINISVYIPTYIANNKELNRIGFKNTLSELEDKLKEKGLNEERISNLLKPLIDLESSSEDFWNFQSKGLVAFLNENVFEFATVPIRFEHQNLVEDYFYFRPVLPLLDEEYDVLVMSVSPQNIQLFNAKKYEMIEFDIEDLFPQNLEESHWHIDKNKILKNHESGETIFHGQGGGKDSKEERVKRFFRDVYTGLEDFFKGEKRTLILAGTDKTVDLFKQSFHYKFIHEKHISGNHDETSVEELYEKVNDIITNDLDKEMSESLSKIDDVKHKEIVQTDIKEIVKASITGRIDSLYIKPSAKKWGYIDNEKLSIKLSKSKTNGEVDLYDRAAIETLLKGGKVHFTEKVEDDLSSDIVALLRH